MEDKTRYKSLDGQKFEISVEPRIDNSAKLVILTAHNINNRSESLALAVIVNRSTCAKAGIPIGDERLSKFLLKQGLKLIRDNIDSGIKKDKEIVLTDDDMKNMNNDSNNSESPEEEFKLRYQIQKDILACLYKTRDDGITSKELVDYVWDDSELLLQELFYLNQRQLISCPRFSKELLDKGGDNNKNVNSLILLNVKGKQEYEQIMEKDIIQKNTELKLFKDWVPFASNKKVFLAHRFNETPLIKQIKDKLIQEKFIPIEGKVEDLAPITEDILKKIQSSGFFLALITPYKEFKDRTFSTSSWILMEIGAAIAYGKIVLVLAEDCVEQKEYAKKLQPDGQYEIFNREKDFEGKLKLAVERIKNEWEKSNK